MANADEQQRAAIIQDVLAEAMVEIVGRIGVTGFRVKHMKIDARLFLDMYARSHPGDTFHVEYTDERK